MPETSQEQEDSTTKYGTAIVLMISAALCFSLSAIALKRFGVGLPVWESVFFRSFVGFVIILGLSLFKIQPVSLGKRKKPLFFRGLFGTLGLLAFLWSIQHMDLALATALNHSSPIFVSIFAAIFLKERFGCWIYLAVCLAFSGVAMILMPDFSSINLHALVALSSGFFAAIAYTVLRTLRKSESSNTVILWFLGMGTLIAPLTIVFQPWILPIWTDFWGLIFAGFAGYIAQVLMTRAYQFAPATIVTPFIYTSTISSLIMAWWIWGEWPAAHALAGAAIILVSAVSIALMPKGNSRMSKQEEKAPLPR